MSARLANDLLWDEAGAVMLEVAASLFTFFVLIFGVIEFTYVFFQWNSATMATERGARLAAVSDPVATELKTMDGLTATNLPGDPMPDYNCTCDGSTQACTSTAGTTCTYSSDAMKTILYGRPASGVPTSCISGVNGSMCVFMPTLQESNIVVKYQNTGMGYAGRQSGPIPTITVSLKNVSYNFLFLNSLLKLTSLSFPARATSTVTGEDLKAAGS